MKGFIVVHDPSDNMPIMIRISSIVILFGREDDSSLIFLNRNIFSEDNERYSFCACKESINEIVELIDE